jgi:general secretion pathway protein A
MPPAMAGTENFDRKSYSSNFQPGSGFGAAGANRLRANSKSAYLHLNARALSTLSELTHGIQARKGLLLLTGEIGTGKTALVTQLRDWLDKQSVRTAFIFNPLLDTNEFFDYMLSEFGIRLPARENGFRLFSNWLYGLHRSGKSAVLIVDEAQGLSVPVLQALVPLLNLEMDQERLLQIVLVGQPDLNEKLKRPELRPLMQRVAVRSTTAALSYEELQTYLEARAHATGSSGQADFTPEALHSIFIYSRGVIRVVNLLCDHALMNAQEHNARPVPAAVVEQVARKFELDELRPVAPVTTSFAPASLAANHEAPAVPDLNTIAALRNELILGAAKPAQAEGFHGREIPFVTPIGRTNPVGSAPAAAGPVKTSPATVHPIAPASRVTRGWFAAPAWRAWIPKWYRDLPTHLGKTHEQEKSAAHQSTAATLHKERAWIAPSPWRAWIPHRHSRPTAHTEEVHEHLRSWHSHHGHRLASGDYKSLFSEVSQGAKYATFELFRWLREPMHAQRQRRVSSSR